MPRQCSWLNSFAGAGGGEGGGGGCRRGAARGRGGRAGGGGQGGAPPGPRGGTRHPFAPTVAHDWRVCGAREQLFEQVWHAHLYESGLIVARRRPPPQASSLDQMDCRSSRSRDGGRSRTLHDDRSKRRLTGSNGCAAVARRALSLSRAPAFASDGFVFCKLVVLIPHSLHRCSAVFASSIRFVFSR